MIHYYIQENLLLARMPTLVKNEAGENCFILIGTWGTKGDVLSLSKIDGTIVASVKQVSQRSGIWARFDLYQAQEKIGSLRRLFSFQNDFYFISHLTWLALGNIPKHQYSIYSVQKKIMQMSKSYLAEGNYYDLQISDEQYAPICICISAILDYWQIDRSKKKERVPKTKSSLSYSAKYKKENS